ncbi:MAG TPA: MFS transporter [Thermoplasmata archaeon]|nr:MFS transporter [Thermoplasmata archaeon]
MVGQADEKRLMRRFFVIWGGEACSLVGSALVQFALVWWLTIETGSATVLAFAMMMAMLPQIVIGPFAGALVDRWNRRHVMIWADLSIALATAVLIALFAADVAQVWHIYAILFVRSAGGAFQWPAMAASTTLMVPKKHLARVGGLNEAIQGAVSIAAPALGAVLLLALPMWGVLSVDLLTAGAAIVPLLLIKIPQPSRSAAVGDVKPSVLGDIRSGLRFVLSWRGAVILLLMVMVINLLFAPAMSLLPLLIKSYFGKGVVEFATMEMALGVSLLLGGLALGLWGGFKRKIVTVLVSGALSGMGVLVVGLVPPDAFYVAVAGLFFTGFTISFANGSVRAVLQSSVPPDMQGRVFGLMGSMTVAMTPLGLAVAGPLSDVLGVQIWFVIAGVGLSAIMLAGFLMPSLMHIEDAKSEDVKVEEL